MCELRASVCVVRSSSLREAHTVWPCNARSELIGTRLRATEATNRCTPQCSNVQLIEPDTMDMASMDEAHGFRSRGPPRQTDLAVGVPAAGGPVTLKKSAI